MEMETEDGRRYRLHFNVSPAYGKWKAWLIHVPNDGEPYCVARAEDQPGACSGLHVHAHCDDEPEIKGAGSIPMPYRLPEHRRPHRRNPKWTKAEFTYRACCMFRAQNATHQEELFVSG